MKKLHTIYLPLLLIFYFFIIQFYKAGLASNLKTIDIPIANILEENKIVYLTFDDGPSDNTIKILDILDKYDIPATFFVVGPSYKLKNSLLKEIVNKGHSLAIHSYNHEYSKIYKSEKDYLDDFYMCLNWIKQITNTTPKIYRFPGGSSNTITTKAIIQSIINTLSKKGFKHTDWNVDSFDSHYNKESNLIIKNTIDGIKTNEEKNIFTQTILLHDNTKKIGTTHAISHIIEYLIANGYQFKTLNENSNLIQHVKKSQ